MLKVLIAIASSLISSIAFASKCSVALILENKGEAPLEVKASITLEKEAIEGFYKKPNTDKRQIGYTTSFIVEPKSYAEEHMFYFCGYEEDPKKFWINYQTGPNSELEHLYVNYKTRSIHVVSGG